MTASPRLDGAETLTPPQASDHLSRLLGLSLSTQRILAYARDGVLPHRHLGKRVLFVRSELDQWWRNGGAAFPDGGWRRRDDPLRRPGPKVDRGLAPPDPREAR